MITTKSTAKITRPINQIDQRKHIVIKGTHEHHLANTTESSKTAAMRAVATNTITTTTTTTTAPV